MMPLRPCLALSLMMGLVVCGGKDGQTGGGSTGGGTDTGRDVTTDGLSMSSDPTANPPTGGGTTASQTTGGESTTNATTAVATLMTSGDVTTDPTADPSTGGMACQIDQPRPGQCDGGKPQPARPFLTGAVAPAGGPRGPGGLLDGADDEAFASTGCNFLCEPDMGDAMECDVFAQDCAPGEKCNAWANNGGNSWNSTRCVPVAANPDQVGEPCTVEGSAVSGIDSCAKGSMCFGLDDDNNGTCVEQCSCSIDNPVCTTQNTTCTISNDDVLALCLPVCDPLSIGACGANDVCVASGELFICVVDASGESGGAGDECEFINACDPGFLCGQNAGGFPGCDTVGCCTPYCDLSAPACPQGFECAPWYEPGMAPNCFEDLGACILP